MRVHIDEAGQKRGVAEADDLGVGRDWQTRAGRHNPPPLHNHDCVRDHGLSAAVDQARGTDRDDVRRLRESERGNQQNGNERGNAIRGTRHDLSDVWRRRPLERPR
jgi:hypothetical protein